MDPVFPALLIETAQTVAADFDIAVELVGKALFNGPSLAMSYSLSVLAKSVDLNDYILFCESQIPTTRFLPAVHLLAQIEVPIPDNSRVVSAYGRIIQETLLSESPFAMEQLESLARNLNRLPDGRLAQVLDGIKNQERPFLRFLLMLTSVANLAELMEKNPTLVQPFMIALNICRCRKEVNTVATLCIAWHNLCLSIKSPEQFANGVVRNLIGGGAETLANAWIDKTQEKGLRELLATAFSDVIVNVHARKIVVENAKKCRLRIRCF
jgi:hypothetical protein